MKSVAETMFTPGPWTMTYRLDAVGRPNKSGRYVILWPGHLKKEDFFIAEMPFAAARGGDIDQHEANAHLIAAAPALYEALKQLTLMSRASGGTAGRDEALCAACEDAEAALSKARGEA